MLDKITDRIAITLLSILSIVLCLDLFLHKGTPTTFDAPTHITNIVMFNTSIREGEIPGAWNNTFANYGLPMPLITQQLTSYTGAIFLLFVAHPALAYHLTVLFFTIAANIAMYYFLRLYTDKPGYALLAAILYAVAPYKLVNIYARGALPEYASALWIPVTAWGMHGLIAQKKAIGIIAISAGVCGLFLTHPMSAVIATPFLGLFALYLCISHYQNWIGIGLSIIGAVSGIGIAAYYLIPLTSEIKYFVYGTYENNLKPNEFLTLQSLYTWQWPYWSDVPTRGYTLRIGITEQIILVVALIAALVFFIRAMKKKPERTLFNFVLPITLGLITCVYLFLLSPLSLTLYEQSPTLANIQYPTRMLTGMFTVIPLIMLLLINRSQKLAVFFTTIVLITMCVRIPQAHGKNYLDQPREQYEKTTQNLHGNFLNTVWMDAPEKYAPRTVPSKIVNGEGDVTIESARNSSRQYKVNATTPVQIVDYTFFFPGWKVYANGIEVPIEFQDIMYRGLITYRLEPGTYNVEVKFIQTRVRKIGIVVSILSVIGTLSLYAIAKRYILRT